MNKLTIIHSVYERNPLILNSIINNLNNLFKHYIDFKYIVFNDNGDEHIKDDLKSVLEYINYFYSKKNYGNKICSGGWIGSIEENLIDSEYIQPLQGQDDFTLPNFYKISLELLNNNGDYDLCHSNFFHCDELMNNIQLNMHPLINLQFDEPQETFNQWFGVNNKVITRANNMIAAPTVIYRTSLHEKIGLPDLETFFGAGDFEYWSRALFFGIKCLYINEPCVLYTHSQYSTSNKPNADKLTSEWLDKIKQKYQKLLNEK